MREGADFYWSKCNKTGLIQARGLELFTQKPVEAGWEHWNRRLLLR
jgi:hypothetical protein